jgi:hypothetical protein
MEPDEVDNDIYDEIANLENWQTTLSDLIANNDISQEEFDAEMLKTRYYLDIKTKTYVLEDDDLKIINKLREAKKAMTDDYKKGNITEAEFNENYVSILRKEYNILRSSESTSDPNKQQVELDVDIDLPLSEKLEKLYKAEMKQQKTVAKKHGIVFPTLPQKFNKEQLNQYYNFKITNTLETVIPEIEEYLQKYAVAKQLVGYHTSSFNVAKIFYNTDAKATNYEFKMVPPISNKLSLKVSEKRINLLSPEEQVYSDRLNILKNRMRQMSRVELLKCAGVRTIKFMSYIERLKENKQNVIKFKSHPENYKILKQIIEDENTNYYKIPSDRLFKEYIYTRPDVLQSYVEETEADLANYVEQGNVAYLAIKAGADLKNLGEGLESFTTILPFEDELYTEFQNTEGDETEIGEVWELRLSLPGSKTKNIVKRYLSFDDYLTDFKEILINNSRFLSGKSRDIINSKIRKINFYIKYKEDPEIYLQTGHTTVSDLFKKRAEIYTMRQNGVYKLLELITIYYPGADTLVGKIESDIFDYSSSNYNFNISKIEFLINNFQDKLEDLVSGTTSIIELLTYETPKTLPEEDVDIRGDKQENINLLLNWSPDTSIYDSYESELQDIEHSFKKFKKDHPEISNLEITQIMSQYSEKIQWKKSLENYNKLKVPDGYIELNFRLRYLLRERNKLPSRRVFTLASVSDRISIQQQFLSTFKQCNLPEPNKYSILTETIIYGLSRTPEDYKYYSNLVNTEYKKLCEYFTKVNLSCSLDSSGNVECISPFEPNILIPIITEFLVTQGEFSSVDIERLKNFTENVDSDNILSYIKSLRGDEIDSYNRSIMEQVNSDSDRLNQIYLKASRILKSIKFRQQLDKLAFISYNTYKPPIVNVEKPVKIINGKEYTPDYIKVGDYYVYGGFYPTFNSYSDDGSVLKENYTRSDLEHLASIFNLELIEDSFELYKSIIEFIQNYNKKDTIIEKTNFNPIEYNEYYEYLKIPTKTIMFAYRPRIGVQDPGEVYTVVKDNIRIYGVPFDFNKDSIPIYNEELKEKVDNGFIIIEGPCIFQKSDYTTLVTSDSYINIEYKDFRGKSKLFREGVSVKKILKRSIDSLNTCNRFVTKEACDDSNSYSLDVKGLKFKCKWLNEQCKGVTIESDELKNFDINKVKLEDSSKNELWQKAIDKSIKYVEELTKLNELSQEEITTLSKEQKTRLLEYFNRLNQPKRIIQDEREETTEVRSYSLIDQFDFLKLDTNVSKLEKTIINDYTDITIYTLTSTTLKLPMRKVIIGSEYTINGDVVIPKEYMKNGMVYICEVKETGETIVLKSEEFRRVSNEIVTKPVPMFCLIKNEDLPFLNNLPGYYYYLKRVVYTPINDNIDKTEEIDKISKVPTNFITPSSLLNGKPLITRSDILEAIALTAFNTLMTDDSFIYYITNKVNAEKSAIEFAVKNKVDINVMFSKIIGTITLLDVIEEYETKNPKKIMSKTEITDIILEAIRNEDKKQLSEYFLRAKRSNVDPDIIKEAKRLLIELPSEEEVVKVEPEQEPKRESVPIKNMYTTSRRRR